MAKDFYIFRHGETELNRRRRWQGSGTDYDLTEDGVSQAEELSAKLAGKGIEVIYSSPLLRARHTAEIAARMLKVPVKTEADLRECFYGEAEGRPIAELQKEMPEIVNNWSRPGGDLRFPGGESRQGSFGTGAGRFAPTGRRKFSDGGRGRSRRHHGGDAQSFRL